jgi:hypothetical protein
MKIANYSREVLYRLAEEEEPELEKVEKQLLVASK